MTYSSGEALILTRVRACTGFGATNTDRSDWKLLNSGISDHYAILRPMAGAIDWRTLGQYTVTWGTIIEVWQRYTDETTTQSNLFAYVANLFTGLMSYPHMGGAITDSTIRTVGEPQEMWREREGGPFWLRQEVLIEWYEEVTVTFAE